MLFEGDQEPCGRWSNEKRKKIHFACWKSLGSFFLKDHCHYSNTRYAIFRFGLFQRLLTSCPIFVCCLLKVKVNVFQITDHHSAPDKLHSLTFTTAARHLAFPSDNIIPRPYLHLFGGGIWQLIQMIRSLIPRLLTFSGRGPEVGSRTSDVALESGLLSTTAAGGDVGCGSSRGRSGLNGGPSDRSASLLVGFDTGSLQSLSVG